MFRYCRGAAVLPVLLVVLVPRPLPAQSSAAASAGFDLSTAVVVASADATPREQRAVRMLVEEIEERTRIRLPVADAIRSGQPAIRVSRNHARVARGAAPLGAEGYSIAVTNEAGAARVDVTGADERGVLFGVGRLLRELRMGRDRIALPRDFAVRTAPRYPLRGHQLGYRPKTNSYDGWTVAMWEQYIRDLAVWGTNAIELIPPRSDDASDSPHFPVPQRRMMVEMSRLADEYGLDVWIWYPALDESYADASSITAAVREWGSVFAELPRVDAVFVPGGDPGHTRPRSLVPLLERQTAELRRHHPRAQMWVSPQGFTSEWMDEFYEILRTEPEWLTGIVFGPQTRDSLPVLRSKVPARYPIRRYPDITHTLRSEYPVPEWDLAHALTSGREPINPRPRDQAAIFRKLQAHAIGFITYSEGCNDDVNKIVWNALGWDPDADIVHVLREYSRYFIGDAYTESFAQGLLALERNWRGLLLSNGGVETTLQQFASMERDAPPPLLTNWRFQQALYRAYYDAYQRRRLLYETALEAEAMERLRAAPDLGSLAAIEQAQRILERADREKTAPELRARVYQLAEALFQSIRMQLDTERYGAIAVGRGATLASAETPLNNRVWLGEQFAAVRALDAEDRRLDELRRIVEWTNPGPGGFYDDLGNPSRQRHLVANEPFDEHLNSYDATAIGFGYRPGWRLSWMRHAETFYDRPLRMRYTDLDPSARYRLRVVYAGDFGSNAPALRLVANDRSEIHAPMPKPLPVRPIEFDIPAEATRGGNLTLTWTQDRGRGGSGRGCQVAEVWLMRIGDR